MKEAVGSREVEIKLAVASVGEGRRLLRAHGFRRVHRRMFQDDTVLDDARRSLKRTGCLLRLRRSGARAWLTYKGPAEPGRHKEREEIEILLTARGLTAAAQILARLGFHPVFRYQKFRTEYRRDGEAGLVALDETPIGVFLELEGSPAWIDRTAQRLGFSPSDYITATYADLYLEHCKRIGGKPDEMVFEGRS